MITFIKQLFCNHSYVFLYKENREIVDYDIERQFYRSYGIKQVKTYKCDFCCKIKDTIHELSSDELNQERQKHY